MATRTYALLAMVVVVIAVVFAAGSQAQLLGLGMVNISGIVPCNAGSLSNAATSPVFPNALVQLACNGKVLSSTTTDSNGFFSFTMNLTPSLLNILGGCKVVVNTPLVNCNIDLPSTGSLESGLLGGLLSGLLGGIINLVPAIFQFIPGI